MYGDIGEHLTLSKREERSSDAPFQEMIKCKAGEMKYVAAPVDTYLSKRRQLGHYPSSFVSSPGSGGETRLVSVVMHCSPDLQDSPHYRRAACTLQATVQRRGRHLFHAPDCNMFAGTCTLHTEITDTFPAESNTEAFVKNSLSRLSRFSFQSSSCHE